MAESKNVLAKTPCTEVDIRSRILTVRGVQVMLDWELAGLYGVETRVLNQAVKRNKERFPQRFRFQLTKSEMDELITNCDKFAWTVPVIQFVAAVGSRLG